MRTGEGTGGRAGEGFRQVSGQNMEHGPEHGLEECRRRRPAADRGAGSSGRRASEGSE